MSYHRCSDTDSDTEYDLDQLAESNLPVAQIQNEFSDQKVFVVGDAVECRDFADEHWEAGIVTGTQGDQALVTKTGYDVAFVWDQVQAQPTRGGMLGSCVSTEMLTPS